MNAQDDQSKQALGSQISISPAPLNVGSRINVQNDHDKQVLRVFNGFCTTQMTKSAKLRPFRWGAISAISLKTYEFYQDMGKLFKNGNW